MNGLDHSCDAARNTHVMLIARQITRVSKEPDLKTFAGRVLATRQRLGLSQAEYGRRAGIGQSAVSNYERGLRWQEVSCEALLKMAAAGAVRPQWLLSGQGPMLEADGGRARGGWPFPSVSLEEFDQLTERQKGLIEGELIRAMERFGGLEPGRSDPSVKASRVPPIGKRRAA